MSQSSDAITLQDVRVHLSGSEVLRGISGRVPRGCVVGLVGPNGSGKSTLLRAISGQVPRTSGQVKVNGEPLDRLSRRQMARAVCLLPQHANLTFPFTVREIVAMGRNPHLGRFQALGERDHEVIAQAMCQASVWDLAERSVTTLSGGEQQRALLARSFATEAPTLLLDEPTTSLDIRHQLEILDLLQQFARHDNTILAALHDLNIARQVCSHVMLLNAGQLVAEGPPGQTLSCSRVEQVFGVHAAAGQERNLVFSLPASS